MPDIKYISKVTAPNGTTYNIKDAKAWSDIEDLKTSVTGAMHYIGTTTTAISDGSTTNPITIGGKTVTAKAGDVAIYGNLEFVWSDTTSKWQEFGSTGSLKDLAFKDSASGSYTPAGSVSQPTFTGTEGNVSVSGNGTISGLSFTGDWKKFSGTTTAAGNVSVSTKTTSNQTATVSSTTGTATYTPAGTVSQPTFDNGSVSASGEFTPEGSVNLSTTSTVLEVSKAASGTATYTPQGSVSAPTISVATAGATTTVNSITAVGTLPAWSATVDESTETLSFSWDQGTLPTKGANQTVKTGDAAYSASQPSFTGTGARLTATAFNLPTSASFAGTEGNISVTGTATGTVSQPTFSGTGVRLVTGNIAVPATYEATFTGTSSDVAITTEAATSSTGNYQPTGTVSEGSISVTAGGKFTPQGTVSQPTFTGTAATVTVS